MNKKTPSGKMIPDKFLDLFSKPAYGYLATIMPDGSPQVTPVWVDYDGTHILINSARGRQKEKNILRDPRVAVTIHDPDEPYRYLQIRGRVVDITEKGAKDQIDRLANKYMGWESFHHRPGEVRLIYKILPTHISDKESKILE